MLIRCAVGHIPSIRRIGEITTPMATIIARNTIRNVFILCFSIFNLKSSYFPGISVTGQECMLFRKACLLYTSVTGTGCMVGALTAAYLPGSKAIFTKSGIFETSSIIPDKTKVSYGTAAALLAAVAMGISGELAAEISKGPGSFQTALLDEVYAMTDETLLEKARLQEF